MKVDELKYVVGEAQEAKPVYMRFYGKIDEESTRNFNDEFLWIQDYVKPSKIIISINSEGEAFCTEWEHSPLYSNVPLKLKQLWKDWQHQWLQYCGRQELVLTCVTILF